LPGRRADGAQHTDTIRVLSPELAFPEVLLALGPFAPGATPELEGASEIEIEFDRSATYVTNRNVTNLSLRCH
jgi:hypothetical protein